MRVRAWDRSNLRPDAFAGLGVAAYLVPQVMAYATLAGLEPVVGLWASLVPLTIYVLAGTSRLLSVGPESTTSILTAAALAPLALGDPSQYAAMATMCALVVGVLALLAGLLRVGFIAQLLSRPVLSGYLAGVAVIMIAGQLGKLLGVSVERSDPIHEIFSALAAAEGANLATLAISVGVILTLFIGTRHAPKLPWPLLAVLGATAVTWQMDLGDHGVAVVGQIPQGLPPLSLPTDLSILPQILGPAVGIALVAFADNSLDARAFADQGEEIDADAELRVLGLSNIGAALTSGFPISSSSSRTALAKVAGAHTPAYGWVTATSVVVVLLFAGPVLASFPMAALGGLVVFAAVKIVDIDEFRWLWNFRRSEFWLSISAAVAVLTLDLLAGIGFAIALSAVVMLARVARPHAAVLGRVPDLAGMHDIGEYPTAEQVEGLLVFRYDSPLFFANAENFRMRVLEAVDDNVEAGLAVNAVLLNCEATIDVDSTAAEALQLLVGELHGRGIEVSLARVHVELAELLERAGILDLVGQENVYPTLPTAVAGYEARRRGGSGPLPTT
jgi:high affinity sulfate transporter 1